MTDSTRLAHTRTARLAVAVVVVTLVVGCSGDNGSSHDPPHADRRDDTTKTGGGIGQDDPRPFRPLTGDQPGGPRHTRAIPAEPTSTDLEEAAQSSPTRLSAETFAILLNHAIEDQTPDSQGDAAATEFGALPSSSVAAIEQARQFPGNRAEPGRSFIRSRLTTGATGPEATVDVVEKIKAPESLLNPDEPFIFWVQSVLTLRWTGERWELVDYQSTGASEYEKFSEFTWRGTMDSGRDWRRFDVAESP